MYNIFVGPSQIILLGNVLLSQLNLLWIMFLRMALLCIISLYGAMCILLAILLWRIFTENHKFDILCNFFHTNFCLSYLLALSFFCIVLVSMANVFLKMFSGYSIIGFIESKHFWKYSKDDFIAPLLFCGVPFPASLILKWDELPPE